MKCLLDTRSIAMERPAAREILLSDKDGEKWGKNTRKARHAFFSSDRRTGWRGVSYRSICVRNSTAMANRKEFFR